MIPPMSNRPQHRTNTEVFRALRQARNLSIRQLAQRVDRDTGHVSRIEGGKILPRVDLAIQLARELRGKVEDLWSGAT